MVIQPSDEVLARFGVRVLAALGGRLNLHWLVAALGWPVAPALDAPIEWTVISGA